MDVTLHMSSLAALGDALGHEMPQNMRHIIKCAAPSTFKGYTKRAPAKESVDPL